MTHGQDNATTFPKSLFPAPLLLVQWPQDVARRTVRPSTAQHSTAVDAASTLAAYLLRGECAHAVCVPRCLGHDLRNVLHVVIGIPAASARLQRQGLHISGISGISKHQ